MLSVIASRHAIDKYPCIIQSRKGVKQRQRVVGTEVDEETTILGGACSEILSGAALANLLHNGFEFEKEVMQGLAKNEWTPVLSAHTSLGFSTALADLAASLEPHVPGQPNNDWFLNVQMEGSSAVWAAHDVLTQLQHLVGETQRTKIMVAQHSYHGPPSSSLGGRTGLHQHHQVTYPQPTPWGLHTAQSEQAYFDQLREAFAECLETHGREVAVMLIEPQSGSSLAAYPWPKKLLKDYIAMAQDKGVLVCCDEIMCGLGRHGYGTMFQSTAWDLNPDAVTFGKSAGGGVFPISGVIACHGREIFKQREKTALQSHTYAGSNVRALMTATEVFKALPSYYEGIAKIEDIMRLHSDELNQMHGDFIRAHGQGAMWGGLFLHPDPEERRRGSALLKAACSRAKVTPYIVPVGGFMLSPIYDADLGELSDGLAKLRGCVGEVIDELKWTKESCSCVSTVPQESTLKPSIRTERYKGPKPEDMDPEQRRIYDEIASTRTTGVAGPFGPWLANPALADTSQTLGRICRYETSLELRESELVILMVAQHCKAQTEWDIHVKEARRAGLEEEIIEKLAEGKAVENVSARDKALHSFVRNVLDNHGNVDDHSYTAARKAFGEKTLVEITGIIGYYSYVALTLNLFNILA